MIEILMSIGIIGIIAAVVIIAINPQYQLCQAQDAKRNSTAREVRSALIQYVIDNTSDFSVASTFNIAIPDGLGNAVPICLPTVSGDSSCIQIFDTLTESYVEFPEQDTDETNANYSGYKLYREDDFYFVTSTYAGNCSATGTASSSPSIVASLTYTGPNTYDVFTAALNDSFSTSESGDLAVDIDFNDDGTKFYMIGGGNDRVYEYDLSTAYDVSTGTLNDSLYFGDNEGSPTGIEFNDDGTKLYVVGGVSDRVYEYDLSTAYDVSTGTLNDSFYLGTQDLGVRGIKFNNDGSKLYMVGGGLDRVFEYNLSPAYDVSTASYVDSLTVQTQEDNPRGMAFNEDGTILYIIGFSGIDINAYNLSSAYDVSSGSFDTNFDLSATATAPANLIFNANGTKMYVSGDASVYEFDIDDYLEASANDGSINNDDSLVITLSGDTFQDTDDDNLLDVGSEVTINNIPTGLTAVMTLSNSDATVTLTFTGNASSHQDANDVSSLTFVFDDTAFTLGDAAQVSNSGDSSAYDSGVGIDFST